MNVVPLKKYDYATFTQLAAAANLLRAEKCYTQYTDDEIWALWRDVFRG